MPMISSGIARNLVSRPRAGLVAMSAIGALAVATGGPATVHAHEGDHPSPAIAGTPVQMADIIERVKPSVVNIVAERKAPGGEITGGADPRMDDLLRRFFGPGLPPSHRRPAHPAQPAQPASALGSGFVIDGEGHVVTNNHVIDGAEQVQVVLDDGTTLAARVIGADPRSDLAVLKVEDSADLPAVTLGDSDSARVGEWVITIGNPFGLGGTATAGIISARGRDIRSGPYDDFLQIDAPINRGNSGGPVFDARGEVIGINTAIFSPNGGNVGIGFAIPSAQARPIIDQIIADGHVTRGWLGVQIQPVTDDIKGSLGLEEAHGALVSEITGDSPAARAGLQVTDVILRYNGQPVKDTRELVRLVGRTKPDQRVPLTIWRDGASRDLKVTVGALEEPGEPVLADADAGARPGKLGLTVTGLDRQAREKYRIDDAVDGVLVTGVTPDSPAARQGLRPGDVILRIGPSQVTSPEALAKAVESATRDGNDSVLALVRRGDSQRFVALKAG